MRKTHIANHCLHGILRLCLLFGFSQPLYAQSQPGIPKLIGNFRDQVANTAAFIRNVGQYGKTMKGYEYMGQIEYGYEGPYQLALFTTRGVIFFQRKIEKLPHREERRLERRGMPEFEIERQRKITDRVITMEWAGANANVRVLADEKTSAYHTYGLIREKASGYRKLIFRNMYPGIDVVYNFTGNGKTGFEYSLLVKHGADPANASLQYGGDIKRLKTDEQGKLIIRSDIGGIESSLPVSYYGDRLLNRQSSEIKTTYEIRDKTIRFRFPDK